jgi:ubiquinone/menaquinone biosynthesis C-methylase UbiE
MSSYYPESKVETKGFIAAHYDTLLDIVSFGKYSPIVKSAIEMMGIRLGDKILDLGAGTGRNACLMMKYLSQKGELVGIDISEKMISQFRKKCAKFPNAKIINARADQFLPFRGKFDKVLISLVLHGFPQNIRETVIRNVLEVLGDGGDFFILDYNEFALEEMPFYLRIPFKIIECPYAFDFIERDWKKILADNGFSDFEEYIFFNYVRLLKATRTSVITEED